MPRGRRRGRYLFTRLISQGEGQGEGVFGKPPSQQPRKKLTQSHEKMLLGQKLNTVAALRRTRIHKVPAVLVQPRDLEDVEHVMHVRLVEAELAHRPRQVRVAVEVVLRAREEGVDVGIAPRAEQVVDAAAVPVHAVPVEAVVDDGGEGPHVGQVGPQTVVRADVRGVELLRAAGPEAFSRIMTVPDVQIAWLYIIYIYIFRF